MIRYIRLVIQSDCSIKSMHNFDQLCSEICFLFFFHTTTELLLICRTGELEGFTLEMFSFWETREFQIFRIYSNLVLNVSLPSYFFMEKK